MTQQPPKSTRDPDGVRRSRRNSVVLPDGAGRVVIENISPQIDDGDVSVKRIHGDIVTVSADIFCDGHDILGAEILYRATDKRNWNRAPMRHLDNDRWAGAFTLEQLGRYEFTIEAWRDIFASWRQETTKKLGAGQDVRAELLDGRRLAADAAKRAAGMSSGPHVAQDTIILTQFLDELDRNAANTTVLLDLLVFSPPSALLARYGERANISRYRKRFIIVSDRLAARFSAWYELFPRSQSYFPFRHGSFDDVIARLPYVADMGFDVLYFPPIHPIGRTNRKGKNNSLKAGPGDPGSVYAIGAIEGGHDAIHPALGSFDDFQRLLEAARDHGLEIALDFAIQCSPDHPWIREHPEWFSWRADGTLKFAENPPKKYEDIVNLEFHGASHPALWMALCNIVLFWISHGVKIFRVDNPHTKPIPFWRWLIENVTSRHPDVIFLSEAFTRPKMMKKLAKIGFHQSYTYFTWRNTKAELTSYMKELTGEMADYYRPNFFANTPDINPYYLQTSGPAGFVVRSTLAATLSSSYGIYSGFEYCESDALPDKEEYLDSEKYEIKSLNDQGIRAQGDIRAHLRALNAIRRENKALWDFRNILFLNAWNDQILAYARMTSNRDNCVFVAVNLDPHKRQECDYEIPLWEFGLSDDRSIDAIDLLHGNQFTLQGKIHHIVLDPATRPVVIWRLIQP